MAGDGLTERERIFRWRVEQLELLGLHPEDAEDAADSELDYHEVEALIKSGCEPKRALEIVK